MRKILFLVLLCSSFPRANAQDSFQLAPPIVKLKSAYIRDSVLLEVYFNQPGAAVHYTFGFRDPGPGDPVFHSPMYIKKPGIMRLKALGSDFKASETIPVTFFTAGKKIDSISTSPPQEYYADRKPGILNDAVGGITNYRSPNWIGYNSDSVWVECKWGKPEFIQSIEFAMLRDEASWIFLPKRIELWTKDNAAGQWRSVNSITMPSTPNAAKMVFMEYFKWKKGITLKEFKLLLINHTKIPDWHEAKGERAWIFLDEIIVR